MLFIYFYNYEIYNRGSNLLNKLSKYKVDVLRGDNI